MTSTINTTIVSPDNARRDSDAVVIGVWSDLHVGGTTALCPPKVYLDDGGVYKPSHQQRWLWQCYQDTIDTAINVADVVGTDRRLVVINGDIVDGTSHHDTRQTITRHESVQAEAAIDTLLQLRRYSSRMMITRGTDAHAGKSSETEESIAREMGAIRIAGRHTSYVVNIAPHGVRINIAHHGKIGRTPRSLYNPMVQAAQDAVWESREYGTKTPDIIIRSHTHKYVDTRDMMRTIRVISTPAWQMPTSYIYRIAPGQRPYDVGAIVIIVYSDATYHVLPMLYAPKPHQDAKLTWG